LVSFNNPSTFVSTLNVSGNTTLNNATTIRTTLNVLGDINTSGLSVFGINNLVNLQLVVIHIYILLKMVLILI
jgi:hypothetical protein